MSTTRTLTLTFDTEDSVEIDHALRSIVDALETCDALPTGVSASIPGPIDPDWLDDAGDMTQADHVELRWTACDERGRAIFDSDAVISSARAAVMFRAIGEA